MSSYTVSTVDEAQLANNFCYHVAKEDQKERYNRIRETAKALARCILENVPPSRERSIALGGVEEAMMWANAGIARNEAD